MKIIFLNIFCLVVACSCVAQKTAKRSSPLDEFLADTTLNGAHIGVSVYDPVTKKYLYDYQGNKHFVPASNVKIATCYASMKYLPQKLPGIKYYENDTAIYLVPTGDPTLLHRDFLTQPVFQFLKSTTKKLFLTSGNWHDKELGQGWAWDDYNDDYSAERSPLPVYGNVIRWVQEKIRSNSRGTEESFSIYSDPEVNWKVKFEADSGTGKFKVTRDRLSNLFVITQGTEPLKELYVPFITNGVASSLELLADTLGRSIDQTNEFYVNDPMQRVIESQPLDSVLRPMMYRSDNFFAEQLLLMAANETAGVLEDVTIIDTVTSHLKNKVVWVDGSGLSRYNLFSPHAFIEILDSMRIEFGLERMKAIFPTGDSGTLKGYYVNNGGAIYAKTGSMSGVVNITGFFYGKNKRLMFFSVMINNYTRLNSNARRAIEKFIRKLL